MDLAAAQCVGSRGWRGATEEPWRYEHYDLTLVSVAVFGLPSNFLFYLYFFGIIICGVNWNFSGHCKQMELVFCLVWLQLCHLFGGLCFTLTRVVNGWELHRLAL